MGELRKKLAWQQHILEEDWVIEAYAAQTLIPRPPADAAKSCTALRNANRCNKQGSVLLPVRHHAMDIFGTVAQYVVSADPLHKQEHRWTLYHPHLLQWWNQFVSGQLGVSWSPQVALPPKTPHRHHRSVALPIVILLCLYWDSMGLLA